ncbi:MAG: methyltransferase [Candidatus Magasanikbacteria bacterium]
MKKIENIKIEKLIFGGQGLAHVDDKVVFVWNALPGEIVDIEIVKKKKDYLEAIAINIVEASPERVEPKDKHFLSTSPWQIMSYETENKWKKEISIETYKKLGGSVFENIDPEIIFPQEEYGYRNKMEYSFAEIENPLLPARRTGGRGADTTEECRGVFADIGQHTPPLRVCPSQEGIFSLAFFERGKKNKFPIEKSELADPIINQTAKEVLDWINKQGLERRNLKTLIIRSDGKGNSISALFIKDEIEFKDYPKLNKNNLGFQVYYSTHKCPASVPTKLLYSEGQDFLIADLITHPLHPRRTGSPSLENRGGDYSTKLKFGLLSFFQVHIPIFTKALIDITKHIEPNTEIIDFYSGVGSIGLPLAKNQTKVTLVDNNEEAILYAKENIKLNKLDNCEAHCIPAEKMTDIITKDKTIVLDPPRAGLHGDVTKKLLEVEPLKIIYLSCNLSTQARDVKILGEKYKITFSRLYNFFPRTPHVEGLVVLERK